MIFELYIPWLICAGFILFFMSVGLFAGRDVDSKSDEFLTAGRRFGPLIVALSVVATSTTGFMFVGAVGTGYAQGVSAIWVPAAWLMGEIAFWLVMPVRIYRESIKRTPLSVPDYISRVIEPSGRRSVQIAAGAVIFIATMPYIIGQNIAAGKAFASITDVEPRTSVIIAGGFITLIALIYCLRGGLRSSILTNACQGATIWFVAVILTGAITLELAATGDPIGRILASNPKAFDLFAVHPPLLVVFFFLGGVTAAFGSALSLPTFLMRLSTIESEAKIDDARWMTISIGYGFWGLMVVIGVMLSGVAPSIDDPERSLFEFAENTSPWLLGLALGGVSALILSTIDGTTLVGGSALSDDMANARSAPPVRRRNLRLLGLVAFGGSALGLAVVLSTSSVYDIVLFGVSALAGGIGPAVLISTLNWPTSASALVTTILLGMATAIAWAALGLSAYVAEALPSFIVGLSVHWLMTRHMPANRANEEARE
ncbi:MAG: hypothetical protein AAF224_14445 [Pseudomonadota bacterium]